MSDHSMDAIIVSPSAADAQLTRLLLNDAGIAASEAVAVRDVVVCLPDQAGCAIVVEEALNQDAVDALSDVLRRQPAWCDFPLIIISGESEGTASLIDQLFPYSGNLTLLTRPLSPSTLISAVRVALRARSRQYQVRDLLQQREDSMRRRDEFLAMLAHELRNPLAPIRNAAHVMNALGIDDPVFNRARALIEKQVVHMSRLVNDLLDVSRLELGKVQLQKQIIALNSAVSSAVESCGSLIHERGHTITLQLASGPLYIEGDSVRVEQIISNLITNAAKYTPRNGRIIVSTEQCEGQAVLYVEDNGVGISAGLEQGIFDLFRQDDRTLARSEGGLGIGLTVVKRLVELHHGTIEAQSLGPNKGARFTVKLPLAPEPIPKAASPFKAERDSRSSRILVIEDNVDIRDSLELLLRLWGHEVHFAETGPEGVRLASELKPEIAVVDIGLPGLTGYEVARHIRQSAQNWTCKPKLIAMTGYGQKSDIVAAREAGFDAHLLKPVEPERLKAILSMRVE
ncbi:MAG TPA: ATP-binding protein [Planctomycetota bacterium]|nr:ATP-binding protein [Planctomycetota bacterium]